MPRYISVVPAYGADYRTKKEVLEAFEAGADFRIQDFELSGYVNKNDKPDDVVLQVRYANERIVTIGEEKC
jgi:hypothetical protein